MRPSLRKAASRRRFGWDRLPNVVQVTDVSPRDGLQNEAVQVSTMTKLELIRRLARAGVRSIEATSFVNPKLVPQMADAKEILKSSLQEHSPKGLVFPVLVPNAKGLQAALAAGAREVTLLAAASDTFAQRNTNCTVDENLDRAKVVLQEAETAKCSVRAAISVCLGCPYEGHVAPQRVAQVAKRLLEDGCEEVVICDTIGTGTAATVWDVLEALEGHGIPMEKVGVHFHDTYGQAVANTLAALQFGVAKVDAAVGGVGGCPFAGPGVSGNVATEDVVQLLHGLGVSTGLDLVELSETGQWLTTEVLGKGNGSRAGPATLRRQPSKSLLKDSGRSKGSSKRPLEGLQVLEVGPGLVAGGWTGATLAYFGAEVVKVEPPKEGDALRKWRKLDGSGTSLWWQSIARNKRSLALDLRQPEGRQVLKRLVGQADVLIENFKPGTLERWDMAPDTLRKDNPGLVVARVSGYGQTGPKSTEPGFASVCEGVGGLRFVNGHPGEAPVRPNLSMGDTLAGMNAVLGILLALLKKGQPDGMGQTVDASIAESVFGMLEACVPEYDYAGEIRQPSGSSLTGIVPTGTYPCKDGTFMIIGANGDSLFKRLMKVMGREDLAEDPRFADNSGRCSHQELLEEAIIQWTSRTTASEVEAACKEASVPCGPIFSIKDIVEDEHFKTRQCFEEVELAGRKVKVPSIGPKLSLSPGATVSGGPLIGQHSDEVLREKLRLSDEELSTLRQQGVIA